MTDEKEIDAVVKNLARLAKKHAVEADIKIDGTVTASIRMETGKDDGIKAVVGIRSFTKALTTPELLKAGLSLLALKGKLFGKNKIDVEIEKGTIKNLFGKN